MNPVLLGATAALCWGTLDFIAGRTSGTVGAPRTTAGVTVGGLVLLTVWIALTGSFPDPSPAALWLPALAGAGLAFATICLFVAIVSGPVSLAVPITMAYPATGIALFAILGNTPKPIQIALAAVVMGGVLIVAASESSAGRATSDPARRRRTILYALGSHFIFLFSVLAGQKAALALGETQSVWLSRLAGSVAVIPFVFIRRSGGSITLPMIGLFLLMGGLDVGALVLLFAAAASEHPQLAIVTASGSGAITVILAAIFLKERITFVRWAGILVTFAGIATLSATS
jgi:drug/metabolite transporter (DMT)-like permease